jgi:hypothetical protein
VEVAGGERHLAGGAGHWVYSIVYTMRLTTPENWGALGRESRAAQCRVYVGVYTERLGNVGVGGGSRAKVASRW